MGKPRMLLFPFLGLCLAVLPGPVDAQWRGPQQDGIYPGESLLDAWPEGGPELLWSVDGIGAGYSSAAATADRVYVTGQSMGGGGTWGMLAFDPKMFAAAVPVCGVGDVASARAIVAGGTAVWAFHGDADPRVPVEASRRMVAALRAAGGRPKYTEYAAVKHDSWIDAYPDPALHQWLFEQKRRR